MFIAKKRHQESHSPGKQKRVKKSKKADENRDQIGEICIDAIEMLSSVNSDDDSLKDSSDEMRESNDEEELILQPSHEDEK